MGKATLPGNGNLLPVASGSSPNFLPACSTVLASGLPTAKAFTTTCSNVLPPFVAATRSSTSSSFSHFFLDSARSGSALTMEFTSASRNFTSASRSWLNSHFTSDSCCLPREDLVICGAFCPAFSYIVGRPLLSEGEAPVSAVSAGSSCGGAWRAGILRASTSLCNCLNCSWIAWFCCSRSFSSSSLKRCRHATANEWNFCSATSNTMATCASTAAFI
mmetsp:Transcript_107476/g.190089  ORF Transcript_107476/g.190089 Transcript_107476/m.190089 type:complete len:218 (+) Transcript_107476:324-977(+)